MRIGKVAGLNNTGRLTSRFSAVPQDYIALWAFNNNLNDKTGVFNGTQEGTVTFADGLDGRKCAVLNGSSGIKTALSRTDLLHGFTFGFWHNPDDMNSGEASWYRYLFDVNPSQAIMFGYDRSEVDGCPRLGITVTDWDYYGHEKTLDLSSLLSNGVWAHYVLSYNKYTNILKFYINASLVYQIYCQTYDLDYSLSPTSYSIQGICADNTHIYMTSGSIDKFLISTQAKIATNSDAVGANHIGDCYEDGDYLYIIYSDGTNPNSTDIGIMRRNKSDLSMDSSFGTNGKLSLADDMLNGGVSASGCCCKDSDGNVYMGSYYDWKIHKYNSGFSNRTAVYDFSNLVTNINGSGEWRHGIYDGGGFDGITYDPVNELFYLAYHGNLLFTINKNFEKNSIIFSRPYSGTTRMSMQGLDFRQINQTGQTELWYCDRVPNKGKILTTRSPDSSIREKSWSNLWIGLTQSAIDRHVNAEGKFQDFYVYGRELTHKEILAVYNEAKP